MHKSASFLDVASVKGPVVKTTGASGPIPGQAPPLKRSKLGTVVNLLEGKKAIQEHENEIAEVVIVCEPEQASLMMGGLHPRGSLYERPVNIDSARAHHSEFRRVLREHGVRVRTGTVVPMGGCCCTCTGSSAPPLAGAAMELRSSSTQASCLTCCAAPAEWRHALVWPMPLSIRPGAHRWRHLYTACMPPPDHDS